MQYLQKHSEKSYYLPEEHSTATDLVDTVQGPKMKEKRPHR